MEKIYIIEDDENIRNLLKIALEGFGFEAEGFETAEEGLERIRQECPSMAIFDWMLPGMDGVTAIRQIRQTEGISGLPIMLLTAKEKELDKVVGLDCGADDYMVKPFEMLELLVRIEKVLERTGRARKVLTIRNIMVDVQSHQVLKDGIPVNLKPMEYDLFVLLLQNKNIALGREELLKRVWGEDYLGESRTVDVHIGQLRKKLELYDEIKTIPKLGYRLEE